MCRNFQKRLLRILRSGDYFGLSLVVVSLLSILVAFTSLTKPVLATQTQTDWPMAAADPTRSSHNGVEVPGALQAEWFHLIDPYIDVKTEVVATAGKIFLNTSKGLFVFDATTGNQLWAYGTEMPLSNSPTVATVNGKLVVYTGGFDHRIHAIDIAASDAAGTGRGVDLSTYTAFEAGGGFEVNPLVINDSFTGNVPTILAGNRDGNFYAFNAATGAKLWSYTTGGPIRFSAAYKNGTVYFGADDNVAYALNVTNGSLVWKTPSPGQTGALPGVGFTSYWPVIWTDTTVSPNKDYVIFSGSKKADGVAWDDVNNSVSDHEENYEMYSGKTGYCGTTGTQPYLWAAGTQTINCTVIANYFNSTKPHKRHFFVFNAVTGQEFTPYAPVNWAKVDGGGNKRPPVVGGDGVLYTTIGYSAGGNSGASGWLAGWDFGTSYISLTSNILGAADEPGAYTSGGNLLYWVEGVNSGSGLFKTVSITPAYPNNSNWDWQDIRSLPSKYTSNDLYGMFGGTNGVYTYFDGANSQTPVPYNGRVYLINGNALIAMSPTGGGTNKGLVTAPTTPQVLASISTSVSSVQQRLNQEVQKMITTGHLRPGFMDSGAVTDGFDSHQCYGSCVPGNYLGQYFSNPAETIITLAAAYPYLSSTLSGQVKTYLQNNYGPGAPYDFTQVVNMGWKNGAIREGYADPPELAAINTGNYTWSEANAWAPANPRTFTWTFSTLNIGSYPPESVYAAWKYAQIMGYAAGSTEAKNLFSLVGPKLPTPGSGNDMTSSNLLAYPYLLNAYVELYLELLEISVKLLASLSSSTYPR